MTVLDPVMQFLAAWKRPTVNLEQVSDGAERPRRPVLRVLDTLAREGYLREVADDPIPAGAGESGPPRRNPTWEIIRPVLGRPCHNARRNRDGNTQRDRIWRVIAARRRFTTGDLMRLSGAPRGSVESYVKVLAKSGIIKAIGKENRARVWVLPKMHIRRPNTSDTEVGL